jgi:hypothetical protein
MSKKPSRVSERVIGWVSCLAPMLVAAGCGADFDSPDLVKSLRVLGVQKDHPYAAPTIDPASPSQVELTMLDYDGTHKMAPDSPAKLRPIQRLWFSGCDDLPGDQYFTCFVRMYYLWKQYTASHPESGPDENTSWSPADSADDLPDAQVVPTAQQLNPKIPNDVATARAYLQTYRIGSGEHFTYPIPPYIIENHQPSSDPDIPAYGLSFIFFTLCAGKIQISPDWQNLDPSTTLRNATLGFPFICQDAQGNALGPDDFVGGYTQQFVYSDPNANLNPVIEGVVFSGNDVNFDSKSTDDKSVYCIDGDCVPFVAATTLADPCANSQIPTRVSACSSKCPEYEFSPTLVQNPNSDPPENYDEDTFATKARGTRVGETMWVDYYADRGTLKHTVRHLSDGTEWFDDHDNTWTAPSDPGPANLWAVVHDSRGGTAWVHLSVCVR